LDKFSNVFIGGQLLIPNVDENAIGRDIQLGENPFDCGP
jgi:hypothetical protein